MRLADLRAGFGGRLVTDAADMAQFRSLWALREDISESQGAEGPAIKRALDPLNLMNPGKLLGPASTPHDTSET